MGTADQAVVPMYRLSGEDLQFVHFNVEHRNEAVVGVQGILNCRENSGMEKEYTEQMKRLGGMQCSWKRSQGILSQ